jgi:hypothetical protein
LRAVPGGFERWARGTGEGADVRDDFDWQRRYIPAWKRVLGEVLIAEASFEKTPTHTDLIVLRLDAVGSPFTRRFKETARLHDREEQFTIRVARRVGLIPTGDCWKGSVMCSAKRQ